MLLKLSTVVGQKMVVERRRLQVEHFVERGFRAGQGLMDRMEWFDKGKR